MRLFLVLCVLMLAALTTPVFCQQTANEWLLEGAYRSHQGYYNEAIRCFSTRPSGLIQGFPRLASADI